MFFFGPLHVLFIYGLKRAGAILERDHEVFEEIQRQAAKVPPTQRQAVIDAMKKNRAQLEREVDRDLGLAGAERAADDGQARTRVYHTSHKIAAASAMELNFVSPESARDVSTTGALAPTMTAASGQTLTRPRIL